MLHASVALNVVTREQSIYLHCRQIILCWGRRDSGLQLR